MLMRPMPVPAILLALLVAVAMASPSPARAIEVVPDEPGAFVLPEAAVLQAVVADVDADGRTDLVRLVRGDGDAALVEVWVERGTHWELLGEPLVAVPPSRGGPRTDPVYLGTPVRLLVRRVAGIERITVASQPHFEEIDVGEPCCLLLNDLVVADDGVASLASVAEPADVATSLLVVDLDGDGTDELLSTLARSPSDGISPPLVARVHRWSGNGFGRPTTTALAVGFGAAPFVLGDSDGLPGDEAATIATLGVPGLYRIRMAGGDELTLDTAGVVADQAMAVPLGNGRGIAVRAGPDDLFTAAWPPGDGLGEDAGRAAVGGVTMVGTTELGGTHYLAVQRPTMAALDLLELPGLRHAMSINRSQAAARLAGGPPVPYVGVLAENDVTGPAIVAAGRAVSVPQTFGDPEPRTMATLAGVIPIGLVGGGGELALHHGPIGPAPPGPKGGPFTVPAVQPASWTSIVPLSLAMRAEADAGWLELETTGALVIGPSDLAVGPNGFSAEVHAPAGSRVLTADFSTLASVAHVVPETGVLSVPIGTSTEDPARSSQSLRLLVLTPAGHAYEAVWDVATRDQPPELKVAAATSLGSPAVDIAGTTVAGARVVVGGRSVSVDPEGRFATQVDLPPWPTDVAVEVDDAFGNVTRATVVGVGLFDYRGLPWVPIVAGLVGAAGIFLLLRVPRMGQLPRRSDDDARLEELEPD
jgi:hypothetical protein